MAQRDPADPHILKTSGEERPQTVRFGVDGMSCESCIQKVQQALRQREGVKEVRADLKEALVSVTYDSRRVDQAAIHELILSTGYQPAGLTSWVTQEEEHRG